MKVGDRLRPRRDLVVGEAYGHIRFLEPMENYLRNFNCVEIRYVGESYFYIKYCGSYAYSKEMFIQKEDL
jgi:hypothetical protein